MKKLWDVYRDIPWPERLDDTLMPMSPELVSLYGTPAWDALDEAGRRKLALHDVACFFSITLHGERPLLQGLAGRMYVKHTPDEITDYLHHFLDEENKHMIMFAEFCNRYAGGVYPEKKIVLERKFAKGEDDVVFFIKVMIVEELGDYYNVMMQNDERVEPLVRELNRVHHSDEARHLIFGRVYLKELWDRWSPTWSAETLDGLRAWLPEYLRSSWRDFYNPAVYRDAGIADPHGARDAALASPVCRAHRERVSEKLVRYFVDTGILLEAPSL